MSYLFETTLNERLLAISIAVAWQTTVIAGLGLLGASLMRWHAANREWLLRITLISLLVLPALALVVRHQQWTWQPNLSHFRIDSRDLEVADQAQMPDGQLYFLELETDLVAFDLAMDVDERQSIDQLENKSTHRASAILLFAAVWAVGATFCLVRTIVAAIKAHRILCMSKAISLDGISPLANLRQPVFASDLVSSPSVIGFLRPRIVLPDNQYSEWSPCQLENVLLHECAHIVRRDQVWVVLQHVAAAMFWTNPLIHFLNRRLTQAREEVCDNHVLKRSDAAAYGRTLLRVARNGRSVPGLALPIASANWTLEKRIKLILDERRKPMIQVSRRYITGTVLGMGFIVVSLSFCDPTLADDPADQRTSDIAKTSDEKSLDTETFDATIDAINLELEATVDSDAAEIVIDVPADASAKHVKNIVSKLRKESADADEVEIVVHAKKKNPEDEVGQLRREVQEIREQLSVLIRELRSGRDETRDPTILFDRVNRTSKRSRRSTLQGRDKASDVVSGFRTLRNRERQLDALRAQQKQLEDQQAVLKKRLEANQQQMRKVRVSIDRLTERYRDGQLESADAVESR